MKTNVTLTDGVEMEHRNPATFEIPSEASKEKLKVGDLVKIGIVLPDDATPSERIWLKVTRSEKPLLAGTVNHALMFADAYEIRQGDQVRFETRHILDIVTTEQQEQEKTDKAPLRPIAEVLQLSEDCEGAEINIADFTRSDPASIPEDFLLYLRDDDFPEANIAREGERIEVYVRWDENPRYWEHKYSLRIYADAMVNAAKILIAEGRQLSNPELIDEDYIGACWGHAFSFTTPPDEIVKVIKETFEAIQKGADALLP